MRTIIATMKPKDIEPRDLNCICDNSQSLTVVSMTVVRLIGKFILKPSATSVLFTEYTISRDITLTTEFGNKLWTLVYIVNVILCVLPAEI